MKTEKVVLSFVAILVGLLAAGIAFYLYQMTKTVPPSKTKPLTIAQNTPTPTPDNTNFLTIDNPADETVSNKKTITVSGKTAKDATLIISSEEVDQVVKPAANGDFTLTINIGDGATLLRITAIFANGQEKTITRTITYSTESF